MQCNTSEHLLCMHADASLLDLHQFTISNPRNCDTNAGKGFFPHDKSYKLPQKFICNKTVFKNKIKTENIAYLVFFL